MTLRERWLTTGLILTGVLLVVLSFWQLVRYGDTEQAVREWVSLEERSATYPNSPAGQARPEIRSMLAKGDFAGAQRRIQALREEENEAGSGKKRGSGIPLDKLWPPKSKERERARQALRDLVKKQEQGYQMRPAQEALLRVADAARSGKRDLALAAFSEAEALIQRADLRPGFRAPKPPPGATPTGGPPGGTAVPPANAATIQGLEQMQGQLAAMAPMAQDPQQRALLQQFDSVLREAIAAARAGKDVTPVGPAIMGAMAAGRGRDPGAAAKLLEQARTLIRNAKPLPPGAPTAPPMPPSGVPGMPSAGGPPPMVAHPLPPVGPPMGMRVPGKPAPGAPSKPGDPGEQVLAALDAIRRMPEPLYRQNRAQLLMMLGPALAGMRGGGVGAAPPAATIGASPSLAFGRAGEILTVRSGGRNLSEGLSPGGLALVLPGAPPRPIPAPVKVGAPGLVGRAALPGGALTLIYRREGDTVIASLKVQRKQAGPAANLTLALPLRAAGWRWQADGPAEVVAVDGTYAARPGDDGKLPTVTLQGAGASLTVAAPTATEVALDPEAGRLIIRFSVSANAGTTEYEARLSSPAAPNPSASEPPK